MEENKRLKKSSNGGEGEKKVQQDEIYICLNQGHKGKNKWKN